MPMMELTPGEVEFLKLHRDRKMRNVDQLLLALHATNMKLHSAKTDIPHAVMTVMLQDIADAIAWIANANGEAVVSGDKSIPLVMKRF